MNWLGFQVTTARKGVTLLLSYLIFTKPLTGQHGTGLLLITMGIVLKLLPNDKPQKRASIPLSITKAETPLREGNANRLMNEDGDDGQEKRPLV